MVSGEFRDGKLGMKGVKCCGLLEVATSATEDPHVSYTCHLPVEAPPSIDDSVHSDGQAIRIARFARLATPQLLAVLGERRQLNLAETILPLAQALVSRIRLRVTNRVWLPIFFTNAT
jgi:hypothetical protein